jgi:hypothetical protein
MCKDKAVEEDGTYRLFLNVGNQLSIYVANHSRKAKASRNFVVVKNHTFLLDKVKREELTSTTLNPGTIPNLVIRNRVI